MRIIFAGTPDFAAASLGALIASEHDVVAVYTQPDRPKGRGRKLQASPVKSLALEHQLDVRQPVSLTSPGDQATLTELNADLMIVVAYGLLLPEAVLNIPARGCVNVHASLLPRWRGAAPIARSLLAGDTETGITIMQMDAGLDTGPMLLKKATPIEPNETAGELEARLAKLGAEALLTYLSEVENIQGQAQDGEQACYAKKLQKEEACLDWQQSAQQLHRTIRGFNPRPIAQSTLDTQVIRIWSGKLSDQASIAEPGTIVSANKHGIAVATTSTDILLTELQLQGGKVLTAQQLLNSKAELFAPGQRFQ